LEEERAKSGTRQAHIAKALDVHRSVISRELRGLKDISLGRIGEIAWALGRDPVIELREHDKSVGDNKPAVVSGATLTTTPVSDRIAGAWAGNATTASSASLYEVQE
jgi:transcriptional regulator with XRE-family HTH domain